MGGSSKHLIPRAFRLCPQQRHPAIAQFVVRLWDGIPPGAGVLRTAALVAGTQGAEQQGTGQ